MTDRIINGDIGTEHIHALQQIIIKTGQLRILKPTTPIVGHQLVVSPDGKEPVGIDLMGMYRKEGLQCLDSLTETAVFQMSEDLIQ